MIDRYARSPMKELWSLEAQYARWLDVELAALHAAEDAGDVPAGTRQRVAAAVRVDVEAFLAEEAAVGHDLLAFLRVIERQAGEPGRHLHRGLTSSDVKDTALSLTLREALTVLISSVEALRDSLRARARRHDDRVMVGRTHGMHAQPITLGLKFLIWERSIERALERLSLAREAISVGRFAGPVGTQMLLSPQVQAAACERLGLRPMVGVTQILPRDLHADAGYAVCALGGAMETMALEIRQLSRTEIGEVEEPSPEGASSMPHKRNPIASERICGLARVLRGHLIAQLESTALWHERDMSHSSVERIVLPDSFQLAHYMAVSMRALIDGLTVHEDAIERNLAQLGDRLDSETYLHLLIDAGMERRDAHEALRAASEALPPEGRLADALRDAAAGGELPAVTPPDTEQLRERLRATSRALIEEAARGWS
jgi:adenylosuccinate lyase